MAKVSIFTAKELKFLKELAKHDVPFMIVGLSAATLQGAPVVTQDIDLWFQNLQHAGIKKALNACHGTYIPPIEMNPPMFAGNQLELFDIVMFMHGLGSFEEEAQNTIEVDLGKCRVKILALERIIKSKETLGRQKDQLVLPVLRDALLAKKNS